MSVNTGNDQIAPKLPIQPIVETNEPTVEPDSVADQSAANTTPAQVFHNALESVWGSDPIPVIAWLSVLYSFYLGF